MTIEQIDKLFEMIKQLENRLDSLENKFISNKLIGESVKPESQKKESLIEFYLKYKPKSDNDSALVLLSYMEKVLNQKDISSKEVLRSFSEARLQSPKNISDKMQMLYKRGLVIRALAPDNAYTWQVSLTGERYLEEIKNDK